MSDQEPPVAKLPSSTKTAIGGIGAGIMAAVGWLTTEFIDLEKSVTQSLERSQRISDRLERSDDDIDERLDVMDRDLLALQLEQARNSKDETR